MRLAVAIVLAYVGIAAVFLAPVVSRKAAEARELNTVLKAAEARTTAGAGETYQLLSVRKTGPDQAEVVRWVRFPVRLPGYSQKQTDLFRRTAEGRWYWAGMNRQLMP